MKNFPIFLLFFFLFNLHKKWSISNELKILCFDRYCISYLLLKSLVCQGEFPNKTIYPAISTFAVQICYANKFLLYSY